MGKTEGIFFCAKYENFWKIPVVQQWEKIVKALILTLSNQLSIKSRWILKNGISLTFNNTQYVCFQSEENLMRSSSDSFFFLSY